MYSRAARYEFFDHTADLGVRVVAPSLSELVPAATAALYAAIGKPVGTGEPVEQTWEFADAEPALLLRDYLTELLHLFDARRMIVTELVAIRFGVDELTVRVQARQLDQKASVLEREVKAVTYHELEIREGAEGYEATFVLDI